MKTAVYASLAVMLGALLAIALSSCTPTPAPVVPVDVEPPIAGDTCEGACETMMRLHCEEGTPAANGISCPTVCHRAQKLVHIDVSCIARAADVTSLRRCGVRCGAR